MAILHMVCTCSPIPYRHHHYLPYMVMRLRLPPASHSTGGSTLRYVSNELYVISTQDFSATFSQTSETIPTI